MGNSLRCCLACVLPCGALDLIRIVHLDGEIEEYGRPVSAREILDVNPSHVLSKPCPQGASHRVAIVPPESELKRGSIYFLIPASAVPGKRKAGPKDRRRERRTGGGDAPVGFPDRDAGVAEVRGKEKKRGQRRGKRGRVAEWRPQLESIHEDLIARFESSSV